MSKKENNKMVPRLRFPEFRGTEEWQETTLSQVAEYENGKAHENDISEFGKYIVVNSKFISTNGDVRKFSDAAYCLATKDDLLMVLSDVPNGRAIAKCFYVEKDNLYTVNQRICKITPINSVGSFLYNSINRNPYFLAFDDGVKQTNLRKEDVLSCPILLPKEKQEQQKIASCLSSLDDLITAHSQKLEALKTHKKGLMQQLFPAEGETVPKLRFEEFRGRGEWKPRELHEFIKERNEFSIDRLPLYSLTIEDGVTPKTERYERSFLVTDEANAYKLVCPNDFAYNPMNLRFGAIARYSGITNVTLSKYYNIFYCDDTVDSCFCEIYFRSPSLIKYYDNVATGSLIEKRRVHFSDFLRFKFIFPETEEQLKIATCLSSLDELISAQGLKIEALKAHKKGLMLGLFPNVNDAIE